MNGSAVAWLLASSEPAIRRLARRDLLGDDDTEDDGAVLRGPMVAALLEGQRPNGGFGGHSYSKWTGAHWRLVSLVELGLPAGEPRAAEALDHVERRRLADGRWRPNGAWYRHAGRGSGPPEVVDWGRDGPSEMLTLNALRVLRAAGR